MPPPVPRLACRPHRCAVPHHVAACLRAGLEPASPQLESRQRQAQFTEEQGRKLGVVGWVKNTAHGTVTGQVQGPKEKVEIMKNWLRSVGSPMSRIDRAVFSNEREVSSLEFQSFTTKY